MIPVLQERFKKSKIIILHIEPRQEQTVQYNEDETPALYGTEPGIVQRFLEKNVPQISIEKIRIIEWRSSLLYYREAYVKLLSQTADFLKRIDAERRTEAVFGRRWVKNFFRNIAIINKILLYRQIEIPVIITGSGPSLEKDLPVIKKSQDFCLVIAASSSVMALSNAGIKADIVVSTDGGPWALRHLYPEIRSCSLSGNAENIGALSVNLCACVPSQCSDYPWLVINDGSFWQSVILHELNVPSILITQKGTVTATAVELAMVLSSGSIYLSGMDFSVHDIRSHTRPYAFDFLFTEKSNRFLPVYCQAFTRSSKIRHGGSMDIYASWFKNQLTLWQKNIFSIGRSDVFNEGNPFEQSEKHIINKSDNFKAFLLKDAYDFRQRGANALFSAMKNSSYSRELQRELGSLLFPGITSASRKDIEKAICEIAEGIFR